MPERGSKVLRVALVGEYPTREGAIHEGGVQSVTHVLAHALARRDDIECHVVCATTNPGELDRQVGRLEVHFVPRSSLPRLATLRWSDVPRLKRRIRALAPDLVHGQGQDRHGIAAVETGLPAVVTPHGVIFLESRMLQRGALDLVGAWKKQMMDEGEREVFARASDMILISPYLARTYGAMLTARRHSIENPVNESFFSIARKPEAGRLLFVGMVSERKCVPVLIDAMAELKRGPAAQAALRIVGPIANAALELELKSQVERHGLQDRITFRGPVDHAELLEEYAKAELLLLSSREETAPQVIAQAMACGLPTVSSAVGGVPDLLEDGPSGALFPIGDAPACARAIAELLAQPARLDEMGRNARDAAARRFHPDSVAAQTAAVYHEIVGRSAR